MRNLIEYAVKAENDFFEQANSKMEYHQMLIVRIEKIHQELNEKRQQHRIQLVKGHNEMDCPLNQVQEKDWHKPNTPDLRNLSINKIQQAICSMQTPAAVHAHRNRFVLLAKQIESHIYGMAKSKAEYERVIDGRANKIKKDLEERLKMMQKMPAKLQIKQMLYFNRIKPLKVINNKDWRESLTPGVRNSFVNKLLQNKFPGPAQLADEDINPLIKDVKKIEADLHDKANSPSEYYALLLEKSIEFRNIDKKSN